MRDLDCNGFRASGVAALLHELCRLPASKMVADFRQSLVRPPSEYRHTYRKVSSSNRARWGNSRHLEDIHEIGG
jgi:hypothetical protein